MRKLLALTLGIVGAGAAGAAYLASDRDVPPLAMTTSTTAPWRQVCRSRVSAATSP